MVILFILFGDFVIQCFGARYCDYVSITMFRALLAAGVVELMFEAKGVFKIYRRKSDKMDGENDGPDSQN